MKEAEHVNSHHNHPDGRRPDPQPAKKPYKAPTLIVHGSIGKLTGGIKTGSSDIGMLTATGL